MSRKKAFTLIELLVVISIIALLLSIVMPALRKAQNSAQGLICRAHMNGLIKGWILYAGDNDSTIVGGDTRSTTNYDWVLPPNPGIVDSDPERVRMSKEETGVRAGALFRYTEDFELYHCPADRGIKGFVDVSGGQTRGGYRSCSIPTYLKGELYLQRDSLPPDVRARYVTRISEIISPGNKFVFIENNDNRGYNIGSWMMNVNPPGWIDPISVWHNNQSTFAFADGHVEAHKWVDQATIDNAKASVFNTGTSSLNDISWLERGYIPKTNPQ